MRDGGREYINARVQRHKQIRIKPWRHLFCRLRDNVQQRVIGIGNKTHLLHTSRALPGCPNEARLADSKLPHTEFRFPDASHSSLPSFSWPCARIFPMSSCFFFALLCP